MLAYGPCVCVQARTYKKLARARMHMEAVATADQKHERASSFSFFAFAAAAAFSSLACFAAAAFLSFAFMGTCVAQTTRTRMLATRRVQFLQWSCLAACMHAWA